MKNFESRGRLLVVNGVKWRYTVGKSNTLAYSENGKRVCMKNWKLKGCSDPNDLDKYSVFPIEVANYLCQII